jgi:hypothetical protein
MNIKAGGGGNRKTCRVTEVAGIESNRTVFIYHEAVGTIAVGRCCCDLWSKVGHRSSTTHRKLEKY